VKKLVAVALLKKAFVAERLVLVALILITVFKTALEANSSVVVVLVNVAFVAVKLEINAVSAVNTEENSEVDVPLSAKRFAL